MTAVLERDVARLIERMVPIGGIGERTLGARAAAHTRPAFYDPKEELMVNVDNVLLALATIANEPAIAAAVAHGNYKDNGCALASAAAMVATAAELATDFLGEADIGPALQRSFYAADARIREVAEGPMPDRDALLGTAFGTRKTLSGIGASMLAAVVTTKHVFVAHSGECQAWLVLPGAPPKQLTRAHTLANTPEGRAAIAENPSLKTDYENVMIRVLGFDNVQVELSRAPFPKGARLVIGNPCLAYTTDFSGPPLEAVLRIANAASAHEAGQFLPATLAIIDADDAAPRG